MNDNRTLLVWLLFFLSIFGMAYYAIYHTPPYEVQPNHEREVK